MQQFILYIWSPTPWNTVPVGLTVRLENCSGSFTWFMGAYGNIRGIWVKWYNTHVTFLYPSWPLLLKHCLQDIRWKTYLNHCIMRTTVILTPVECLTTVESETGITCLHVYIVWLFSYATICWRTDWLLKGCTSSRVITAHATLLHRLWFGSALGPFVACHTPLSLPLFPVCLLTTYCSVKEEMPKIT